MKTGDYRPLPECLRHGSGFGGPPKPPAVPQEEPSPKFLEMIRQDALLKEAREPLADLFKEGSAAWEGTELPYRLYVPEQLEPDRKYPLVLFLHGGGERGSDNRKQLLANDGAAVWVRDQLEGKAEPCFVLAPQSPENGPGWLEPQLLAVSAALDAVKEKYPVDETRLYLVGMSMGGGGCWRMNAMFPKRFAAVAPMCSACGLTPDGSAIDETAVAAAAQALAEKPLWLFHAADDFVVTPETSRSLVRALEKLGKVRGQDFFYTEYPAECGYNHGCWNPALSWRLMRQWMFAQTSAPAPAFGPPEGAELPFPPEKMAEQMRLEAEAKLQRKAWLSRFISGVCASPDASVPYRLFVPEQAKQSEEQLPMVVVLHGIGGCGCDNEGQILDNNGITDWVLAQDQGILAPCFVFAPQCPQPIPNLKWEEEYLQLVAEKLDELLAAYPIDRARVYLTGLSLGGFGSWNLNRLRPELFAALVTCCPACVAGDIMNNHIDEPGMDACVETLKERPLWMFHAEDDFAIPVEVTRMMLQKLLAAGRTVGPDLHVTIYPAEKHYNHGCWEPAYKDKEMMDWLMAQRRE